MKFKNFYLNESKLVRVFRALPSGQTVFRPDDYITMSFKFALEHAENNHVYEDVPHDVIMAYVSKDKIKEASNPGEYQAVKAFEGEPVYTSKGYDFEGWDAIKNDHAIRKYSRPFLEEENDTITAEFPLAGDSVSNLEVLDDVPNMHSISASMNDYKVLDGIREVPISEFETDIHKNFYSASDHERVRNLSKAISQNMQIKPLIVVRDAEGYYILEGGHRLVALALLGVKSFPAVVVRDLD